MKAVGVVATVLLTASLTPQSGQQVTPQSCVQSARAEAVAKQRHAQPLTAELFRQIESDRVAAVRKCAETFGIDKAAPQELVDLVAMYSEAMLSDLADRAIARGLTPGLLDASSQATLLAAAIRESLRQPKSPERNVKAEAYMIRLDALAEAALDQQIAAHVALNSYYRSDDIDAGIIRHSTWLVEAVPRLNAERRTRFGYQILARVREPGRSVGRSGRTTARWRCWNVPQAT